LGDISGYFLPMIFRSSFIIFTQIKNSRVGRVWKNTIGNGAMNGNLPKDWMLQKISKEMAPIVSITDNNPGSAAEAMTTSTLRTQPSTLTYCEAQGKAPCCDCGSCR